MFKILLVEDDRELNKTVCAYLEQNQEIPILFMTARDDFVSKQRGFKAGIDAEYRTLPQREYTMIGGSSMGGLMALYAVLEYNHIFSRAAALSPSVWVSPARLTRLAREARLAGDTILYMDYGSGEGEFRPGLISHFSRIASILMERGVMAECRIVPWGTHCEASWERQLPFFMNTIMYGLEE